MEAPLPNLHLTFPSSPQTPTYIQPPEARTREYLEERLKDLIDQVIPPDGGAGGNPSITLTRRANNADCVYRVSPQSGALECTGGETRVTYKWPGSDAHEAWRFNVIVVLLAAIQEAMRSGVNISTRDIYYTNPELFNSQGVVNRYIDDLAFTIGVERSDLNVEAAAKGLVAGYYRLAAPDGRITDYQELLKECLVPRIQDIVELDTSQINWVLVIEKEAVFRRLAQSNFHIHSAVGKGILITGKGYPDLRTRAFIRKIYDATLLTRQTNPVRFYALVDSDPDGMSIMSVYKYGSMAHARDNAGLNIPSLRWLGLRMSEVVNGLGAMSDEALIPLTERDRRGITQRLARNPVFAVGGPEVEWRVEMQRMLMLNVKAEIEILYDREEGLEGWIGREMVRLAK